MTTGYKKNGVDIDTLLEPRTTGDPQAAATGYKVNGVDISTMFYPLANGGTAPTSTIGMSVAGDDLNTIFAAIGTVSTTGTGIFTAYWFDSAGNMSVDGVAIPYDTLMDVVIDDPADISAGADGSGSFDVYDFSTQSLVGTVAWPHGGTVTLGLTVLNGHYYGNVAVTVMNELGPGEIIKAYPTIPTIAGESYASASNTNSFFFGAGHYVWANVPFDIVNDIGEIMFASTQSSSGKHYVKSNVPMSTTSNHAVPKTSLFNDNFSFGTIGELDPLWVPSGYDLNGSSYAVYRDAVMDRGVLIASGSATFNSYAFMTLSPEIGDLGGKTVKFRYSTEILSGAGTAQFAVIPLNSVGTHLPGQNLSLTVGALGGTQLVLPADTHYIAFFVEVSSATSAKMMIDDFIVF